MQDPAMNVPDISEKGFDQNGQPCKVNRRLFMQLTVFDKVVDNSNIIETLDRAKIGGVLYEDLNNHRGCGLLTFSENPDYFVRELRTILNEKPFIDYPIIKDYTMLGRSYAIGYEKNVEDWLLEKPKRTVTNKEWPWAIWYPLRRKGSFFGLSQEEQKIVLQEHGHIGHSFGNADFAHDVRLACHGLDKNDNDFVIGLVGKELSPLSSLIETMRKTKQTSKYLQSLGPFFIGKAVWQSSS